MTDMSDEARRDLQANCDFLRALACGLRKSLDDAGAQVCEYAADLLIKQAEIIAKLPTTADGVPVVQGDTIYRLQWGGVGRPRYAMPLTCEFRLRQRDKDNSSPLVDCYSTRAAAKAAKEAT